MQMRRCFKARKAVVFVDDDEEWLAYLLEMPTVSAFGETPEEALQQLAEAFELVKEVYAEESLQILQH